MRMTQKSSSLLCLGKKSKVQGLCRLQNRSLLCVNKDFKGKRNGNLRPHCSNFVARRDGWSRPLPLGIPRPMSFELDIIA